MKQQAVIFDIDGTLADVREYRWRYLEPETRIGGYKDMQSFHRESVNAQPHDWVAEDARRWHELGVTVLAATARKAMWRNQTAMWLDLNNIPSHRLYMRGDHDNRFDVDVKRDMLELIRFEFDIVHAYDDNPSIIELWESEGIPVTVVPGWGDLPSSTLVGRQAH
jgi:FMN phosphatase YigB (HAD superfamily)